MAAYLNETTFEEILTQCGQHANYEGAIVLPHRNDIRDTSVIRFTNGSSIEWTTVSAMRSGDRYHKQRDFYQTYGLGKWGFDPAPPVDPLENATDTGELDDFLNGFKIDSKK